MWEFDISFDDDKLQDIFTDFDSVRDTTGSCEISGNIGPLPKKQKFDSSCNISIQHDSIRQPLSTIWTAQTDSSDVSSKENKKIFNSLSDKNTKFDEFIINGYSTCTNLKPQTDDSFTRTRKNYNEDALEMDRNTLTVTQPPKINREAETTQSSTLYGLHNQSKISRPTNKGIEGALRNSSIMAKSQLPVFLQDEIDDEDLDLSADWNMNLSFSKQDNTTNSKKAGVVLQSNVTSLKAKPESHLNVECHKNIEITNIYKENLNKQLQIPVSSNLTLKQTKNHNVKAEDNQIDYDAFFEIDFSEDILVNNDDTNCRLQFDNKRQDISNFDKQNPFVCDRNLNTSQHTNNTSSTGDLLKDKSKNNINSKSINDTAIIQSKVDFSTRKTEQCKLPISKKNSNSLTLTNSANVKDSPLQTRKRRFPGPAGLLPKLSSDQNIRLPDFSHIDELIPKSPSVSLDKMDLLCSQATMDEFQNEPWTKMEKELGLDGHGILSKYTIAWLNNQAAIKQLSRGKMPFLAVVIKTLSIQGQAMTAFLKDKTGEIQGTFQSCLTDDYHCLLNPGSVIVLRQTGVFSPNPRKHYLNITKRNIFCIYNIQEDTTVCKKVTDMSLEELIAEVQTSSSLKRTSEIFGERLNQNLLIPSSSAQNYLQPFQHKRNSMSPNLGYESTSVRPMNVPVRKSQEPERQYMPVPSSCRISANRFVNTVNNKSGNSPAMGSYLQNRISKNQCREEDSRDRRRITGTHEEENSLSGQNTTKARFQFKSIHQLKTNHGQENTINKFDNTQRSLKLSNDIGITNSLTEDLSLADDELDELLQGISEEQLFGLT